MDSFAPSILPPRVRFPSTTSMLFSTYIVHIVYLPFELECDKNKKGRDWSIFKKQCCQSRGPTRWTGSWPWESGGSGSTIGWEFATFKKSKLQKCQTLKMAKTFSLVENGNTCFFQKIVPLPGLFCLFSYLQNRFNF